jgi:hypothetical protein
MRAHPCPGPPPLRRRRAPHVREEFILEPGATKGRDLRIEVRRIRSGASRDRHGDVVWLDFRAPNRRHLVVDDVTAKSACTSTSVLQIGTRLPLPSNLALRA